MGAHLRRAQPALRYEPSVCKCRGLYHVKPWSRFQATPRKDFMRKIIGRRRDNYITKIYRPRQMLQIHPSTVILPQYPHHPPVLFRDEGIWWGHGDIILF